MLTGSHFPLVTTSSQQSSAEYAYRERPSFTFGMSGHLLQPDPSVCSTSNSILQYPSPSGNRFMQDAIAPGLYLTNDFLHCMLAEDPDAV